MDHEVRTGGFALTTAYAVFLSCRFHIIITLFIYMMGNIKHILRTDAHADLAALAEFFINIYRQGIILAFCFT